MSAKLAALLRKQDAQTADSTWQSIGTLLDRSTSDERALHIANIGNH